MAQLKYYNAGIFTLCAVGFGLAFYSQFIKAEKEKNAGYQAMCDINERINCSKVLTSEYSVGFGLVEKYLGKDHVLNLPNHVLGMVGYPVLGVLGLMNNPFVAVIVLFISLSSNFLSGYLAYILFVVLNDICLVCISIYVVNFFTFLLAVFKLRAIFAPKGKDHQKSGKKKNQNKGKKEKQNQETSPVKKKSNEKQAVSPKKQANGEINQKRQTSPKKQSNADKHNGKSSSPTKGGNKKKNQ